MPSRIKLSEKLSCQRKESTTLTSELKMIKNQPIGAVRQELAFQKPAFIQYGGEKNI